MACVIVSKYQSTVAVTPKVEQLSTGDWVSASSCHTWTMWRHLGTPVEAVQQGQSPRCTRTSISVAQKIHQMMMMAMPWMLKTSFDVEATVPWLFNRALQGISLITYSSLSLFKHMPQEAWLSAPAAFHYCNPMCSPCCTEADVLFLHHI